MISMFSSKFMLSKGENHTDIELLLIADINRNLSCLAIFRSDIVFGMILKLSKSLLVSMFQSLIFSLDAANKNSPLSSKVKLVIALESQLVMFILVNSSKSQYFTVLSVEPFANA